MFGTNFRVVSIIDSMEDNEDMNNGEDSDNGGDEVDGNE